MKANRTGMHEASATRGLIGDCLRTRFTLVKPQARRDFLRQALARCGESRSQVEMPELNLVVERREYAMIQGELRSHIAREGIANDSGKV